MRTTSPPAPIPRVVGERGAVLFASGGTGRAAVDGDVWEIRYARDVTLRAGQSVRVVGQHGDVLLVMPDPRPTRSAPPNANPTPNQNAPTRATRRGRRR